MILYSSLRIGTDYANPCHFSFASTHLSVPYFPLAIYLSFVHRFLSRLRVTLTPQMLLNLLEKVNRSPGSVLLLIQLFLPIDCNVHYFPYCRSSPASYVSSLSLFPDTFTIPLSPSAHSDASVFRLPFPCHTLSHPPIPCSSLALPLLHNL